jgi:hypothetical protein
VTLSTAAVIKTERIQMVTMPTETNKMEGYKCMHPGAKTMQEFPQKQN